MLSGPFGFFSVLEGICTFHPSAVSIPGCVIHVTVTSVLSCYFSCALSSGSLWGALSSRAMGAPVFSFAPVSPQRAFHFQAVSSHIIANGQSLQRLFVVSQETDWNRLPVGLAHWVSRPTSASDRVFILCFFAFAPFKPCAAQSRQK